MTMPGVGRQKTLLKIILLGSDGAGFEPQIVWCQSQCYKTVVSGTASQAHEIILSELLHKSFSGGSMATNLPTNEGDMGLIPRSGRSHREENVNPLQCSCLRNPMDREAWWTTVHGIAEELNTTLQLNNNYFLKACLLLLSQWGIGFQPVHFAVTHSVHNILKAQILFVLSLFVFLEVVGLLYLLSRQYNSYTQV